MTDALQQLAERFGRLTPEEKEEIRRAITGEARDDLIRRGDALDAIRDLITDPVPPYETQRGIQMALRAVSGMAAATPSQEASNVG